jgi:AbrB family looped-hinge helix DNA binding protein
MVNLIYKAEDIFQDIEGDEKNVLMNIPPEIAEQMGWKPGDVLRIQVEETGGISIKKVENE